jgi:GTP pyrophosphokinase
MIYEDLRSLIVENRPDIDINEVDKAYRFADKAHQGHLRYSGEPYIDHLVESAKILLGFEPDLLSIQACLLYDVLEETDITRDMIAEHFGEELAELLESMKNLAIVKLRIDDINTEKWRGLFLAMAKDIRVVFVKLSARLHNMRTLEFVPEEKRERIARETLLLHAAIASRLGMYQVKSELEDLCFRYLYPEHYEKLSAQLSNIHEKSEEYMDFAISQIEELLKNEDVEFLEVRGRMKHRWSIYQKMLAKGNIELAEIHDLFALRIILPDKFRNEKEDIAHLYAALGILHGYYIPMQDRFKDYIALPKPNGYRSLHTTVLGVGADLYDDPTEIQIRSKKMHEESEYGIASHWSYKEKLSTPKNAYLLNEAMNEILGLIKKNPEIESDVRDWIEKYQQMKFEDRKRIEALLLELGIEEKKLNNIKKARSQGPLILHGDQERHMAWLRGLAQSEHEIDISPDKIFVLTPRKDVMELPKGATPIDFAYMVHSNVGDKCAGAKVNGKIVPLDYELKNGDLVDIVTRSNATPNRYWLSIVKTSAARSKIKNWLNRQDKDQNIKLGHDMLNKELERVGKEKLDDKLSLLKDYGGKPRTISEREELLEAIGLGSVSASTIVHSLFYIAEEKEELEDVPVTFEFTGEVLVTGEANLPVVFAACCKPKAPQAIIAYVTRGNTIRIHKQSCRELAGLEGERFISAHWK